MSDLSIPEHMINVVVQYGISNNVHDESIVYLIEPRKKYLDRMNNQHNKNVNLIKKLLTDSVSETNLYTDSQNPTKYSVNSILQYRERVFTTTVNDIIKSYTITHVDKFVWDLNVDNYNDVISSLITYNSIFSEIWVNQEVVNDSKNLLKQLDQYYNILPDTTGPYRIYKHVHSTVKPPNVCMYLTHPVPKTCQRAFDLLLKQMKNVTVVEHFIKGSLYLHIRDILSHFFQQEMTKDIRNDVLIIFNPNYLSAHDTFHIPHINNMSVSIFTNDSYNIMYASKACMYMLYQTVTSESFTEYEESLKNKSKAWKFLYRTHFLNYIKKDFSIKGFL